ncbi:MAG: ABC transporter ATP-binding protein [Alphaproteobacteria bacterium]|nr:ABC transporter ATP-binding protein [Alphaproteobacteria bacterium]
MSDIRLESVSKVWDKTRAVDGVSLRAEAGKFLVLLGPSGCGKSTTLRLIAGLDEATEGRILIGSRDVTRLAPGERGISMVFQSYALFPHLNVAENIVFGLKVRKTPRDDRDQRLKKVADIVGLAGLLDRKPSQLSGGQRQRVALARAIIAENDVCLMDEPLSNLDAQLRHDMRTEIRALQKRLGMTVVYVTHDQTEAMSMADQVILMREGRIEQVGPPEDLYARPATVFTARFIGTPPMNLLALQDGPNGATIGGEEATVVLNGAGNGLILGLRPEHIRIQSEGGIAATVKSSEYHGADTVITVGIGTETALVRAEGRRLAAAGDVLRLGWEAAAAHGFDAASGRRREVAPRPVG